MSITRSGPVERGIRFALRRISDGSRSASARGSQSTRTGRFSRTTSLIAASSERANSCGRPGSSKSSLPSGGVICSTRWVPPVLGLGDVDEADRVGQLNVPYRSPSGLVRCNSSHTALTSASLSATRSGLSL